MEQKAFQDYYDRDIAVCYVCGANNPKGLQIKSFWEGDEAVCRFTPEDHHTAFPGVFYGGLIASLIDCHSIGTAIAGAYRDEGREMDTDPKIMFVTANLNVDYLKPTPMGVELLLRAKVLERHPKKSLIQCSLFAGDQETARGKVLAVRAS